MCSLSLVLSPTQLWCCSIGPAVTRCCAAPKPTSHSPESLFSLTLPLERCCLPPLYACKQLLHLPIKAHSADLEYIIHLCKDLHSSPGPDGGGGEGEERGSSTSFLFNSLHVQHVLECHSYSCQSKGLQLGHPHQPPCRWGVGCVMSQSLQNTTLTPEF